MQILFINKMYTHNWTCDINRYAKPVSLCWNQTYNVTGVNGDNLIRLCVKRPISQAKNDVNQFPKIYNEHWNLPTKTNFLDWMIKSLL